MNIFKRYQMKKPSQPVPDLVWKNPLYFVAFGLGSGAAPFAPGTFGTLMAVPFYLVLRYLPLPLYLLFVLLFIILSSWICDRVSNEIHVHDHPGMCLDEFAGFFVAMIHAPKSWIWIVIGFLLFRLFDIWKPWPIDTLDKDVPGGFGMVIDDVAAGIYSMFIIQLLVFLLRFF